MPFVIDPVAFTILGVPVRWHGLILVAAARVAIWLAQRRRSRHRHHDRRRGSQPRLIRFSVQSVSVG